MTLAEIQNSFLGSVFKENNELDYILPTHSSKIDTIKIYKDTINAQLINTLKVVFPICESMLGKDFFSAMSYQYINKHPSESTNLNEYGKYMSKFMKNFEYLVDYPYFEDIAFMEYLYDEVKRYSYTNIEGKDLSYFDEEEYSSLIFKPVSALQLFVSPFKVANIWKMYKENDIHEIEISNDTTYNIIYKAYNETYVKEVTYLEYKFLNASLDGLTLEEILDRYPEVTEDLGSTLTNILSSYVIQSIVVK